MKITASERDGYTVLALSGRFDAHEAPAVVEHVSGTGATASVVVDLAGVHFIDSTGLSTLVQGMKRCRERGGDLMLCSLQQPVRIIFELTKLDRAFGIHPDPDAAIAALRA